MSSRFLPPISLRSPWVWGGMLGGFLLFAGAALVDYQRNAEESLLEMLNPLGDRQITVERLLEKGDKGKLSGSVKLQGQVKERSPLLNGVVYQLQDRTGSIWIQSQDTEIEVGQILTVRGQPVYKEVLLEGRDFGEFYLQETGRILADTD